MASKLPVPVILFLLSYFLCAVCEEKPTGYDTKYDNIDLTELLKNDRLRKNYVKCLLDEGPCSPDGQELKSNSFNRNYPFDLVAQPIASLKDFFIRLNSRRDSNRLFKMFGQTKKWIGNSNSLSN